MNKKLNKGKNEYSTDRWTDPASYIDARTHRLAVYQPCYFQKEREREVNKCLCGSSKDFDLSEAIRI